MRKEDREGNFKGVWLDVDIEELDWEGRGELRCKQIFLHKSDLKELLDALKEIEDE